MSMVYSLENSREWIIRQNSSLLETDGKQVTSTKASTNTQNPALNNQLKNQQDTKTPSISTSSPLFLRLPFPAKNQNLQQTQPPPPPITRTPAIMIGQCQDSTNKNRKLAVSAGHRPDGEGTKKDTQRSRGSRVTWKPVDAGFFIAALWPHSPLSMLPQTTARFSFIAACHLPLIHAF